jgi:hypothetical protein
VVGSLSLLVLPDRCCEGPPVLAAAFAMVGWTTDRDRTDWVSGSTCRYLFTYLVDSSAWLGCMQVLGVSIFQAENVIRY